MLPHPKTVIAIVPISVANAGTATGEPIDTKGYDFAAISIVASTSSAATTIPTVLKIEEGDTTSSYATFTGAVSGTDYTIATNAYTQFGATGANQNVWTFLVDTRARKRYLRVAISPQTTMVIGGVATLFRGEQAPSTAALAGALNYIAV